MTEKLLLGIIILLIAVIIVFVCIVVSILLFGITYDPCAEIIYTISPTLKITVPMENPYYDKELCDLNNE